MKFLTTAFAITLMVLLSGCVTAKKHSTPATGSNELKPRFSFSVFDSFEMKQGATKRVELLLNRGPYFEQDVAIAVQADGIDITPARMVMRLNKNAVDHLQVVVPRNAAIGAYTVTIIGTPEDGEPVSAAFTIEVISAQ